MNNYQKQQQIAVFLLLLLSFFTFGANQQNQVEILPDDFSSRVFNHISYLAGLGHRQIGSENDKRSIQYIKKQFENLGVDVEIQEFDIQSFEYEEAKFEIGKKQYQIIGLGLNPSKNIKNYIGTAILIDLDDSKSQHTPAEIQGKAIVTNNWNMHFQLLRFNPELVVYVDPADFEKIKSQGEYNYKLTMDGDIKTFHSANVIGRIGKSKSSLKEILITAHFDTYRQNSPGASDNASGVGVLLELARYFKKIENELNCTIKFIAFGGEEIGIVGSRKYLEKNAPTLQQCELLFNIDSVGGSGAILVEMIGGINGISAAKGESQIPDALKNVSWEGITSKWRIIANGDFLKVMSVSNHPQWLVDMVKKSIENLEYNIKQTPTMGSDQLTFAQAGIVTSGISVSNNVNDTPEDVPEKINVKNLKITGEITARIVLNTIKRIEEK